MLHLIESTACFFFKKNYLLASTSVLGMSGRVGNTFGEIAPNGINLGLFKISFSTFWLDEPKCTESDLKKVPDLSH